MINNNAVEELEINYPPITSKILGGTSFKTKSIGDFFVSAFQDDGAIRLTIARKDCQDGITWDKLMEIKDKFGYGDKDGIELYPATDAVLNTANLRHLYIFDHHLGLVRR